MVTNPVSKQSEIRPQDKLASPSQLVITEKEIELTVKL